MSKLGILSRPGRLVILSASAERVLKHIQNLRRLSPRPDTGIISISFRGEGAEIHKPCDSTAYLAENGCTEQL